MNITFSNSKISGIAGSPEENKHVESQKSYMAEKINASTQLVIYHR